MSKTPEEIQVAIIKNALANMGYIDLRKFAIDYTKGETGAGALIRLIKSCMTTYATQTALSKREGEVDEQISTFLNHPVWYDPAGAQIFCKKESGGDRHLADIELLDVRGWGELHTTIGEDAAVKLMDKVGQFIADAINEKLNGAALLQEVSDFTAANKELWKEVFALRSANADLMAEVAELREASKQAISIIDDVEAQNTELRRDLASALEETGRVGEELEKANEQLQWFKNK